MNDLKNLYQEIILDHNRAPRNFHAMEDADYSAEGFNPLCGDKITVFLKIENDIVKEASFLGSGCAISTASASLMTEAVVGKKIEEAQKLFDAIRALLTTDIVSTELNVGKLQVLTGVKEYPSRVKCATLAWHTLQAALKHDTKIISTETS